MKTLRLALLAIWLAACTMTTADGAATAAQPKRDWLAVMRQLDRTCKQIERSLLQRPQLDLQSVAARAGEAASLVRLGYGRCERPDVPGFAQHARGCESWLLQLAIEARQGHGALALDLYRSGRLRHCNDCHDAVDAAADGPR